ncbi:hypothetical protein LWI29_029084 [Acer saccharum]|uniref:Uncharacterized protein n=1 Tax=Acer saccharum TaxID=4024 RepID=A0AA39S3N1_ACESA|nr:hypothetical protein LWI29_029084 [Acer saccharum]
MRVSSLLRLLRWWVVAQARVLQYFAYYCGGWWLMKLRWRLKRVSSMFRLLRWWVVAHESLLPFSPATVVAQARVIVFCLLRWWVVAQASLLPVSPATVVAQARVLCVSPITVVVGGSFESPPCFGGGWWE